MNLQSILFPDKKICDVEEMYFHRDGDWLLFNGYFNLFYLEKHHKYCELEGLSLELSVKGVRRIVLMHDREEIGGYDVEKESELSKISLKCFICLVLCCLV